MRPSAKTRRASTRPGSSSGASSARRGQLLVLEEALGQVELRFDVGLAGGRADRPRVALRAEQEPDRLREDRLPRTGLAGDRRQSLGRRELSLPHEDEVLDPAGYEAKVRL